MLIMIKHDFINMVTWYRITVQTIKSWIVCTYIWFFFSSEDKFKGSWNEKIDNHDMCSIKYLLYTVWMIDFLSKYICDWN